MSKLIAVDNGSTAIKFCWKNNDGKLETGIFKSSYDDGIQMLSFGPSPSSYFVDDDDTGVSIDENLSDPIKTDTPKYQYSGYIRAGVFEALRRTGVTGEVDLVITLPISHFYMSGKQGGINLDNINKAKENLMRPIRAASEEVELPKIKSIKVYPEGVGALAEVISDKEGNLKEGYKANQKCLIIDIGGSTVDIALLSNLQGQMQEKLSINKGVLGIIEDFSALVKKKQSSQMIIKREFAEAAFKGETGTSYKDEVKKASKSFVSEISREIEQTLADPMLSHIIICGGGANLVGNELKSQFEEDGCTANITIPKSPETILARSIFKLENALKVAEKEAEAV